MGRSHRSVSIVIATTDVVRDLVLLVLLRQFLAPKALLSSGRGIFFCFAAADASATATETAATVDVDDDEQYGISTVNEHEGFDVDGTAGEEFIDETGWSSIGSRFQPRVTVVEGLRSRNGCASISNPRGTVWCNGAPTYWITGHQNDGERPRCLIDGRWVYYPESEQRAYESGQPVSSLMFDKRPSDRHYCVLMDVDRDGFDDVICNMGAGKGMGFGYTELYLTNPKNGTLKLIVDDPNVDEKKSMHGLQKYPTMRNRVAVTVRNKAGESEYVFMGTLGTRRVDGATNLHRMFRNVYSAPDVFPYFVEVPGPWIQQGLFSATCAIAGDINRDGREDLVVCNGSPEGPALLALQGANHSFVKVPLGGTKAGVNKYLKHWWNARLFDVTMDGLLDLVVVTTYPSRLWIFRGTRGSPFFDFRRPIFEQRLKYMATDVEVLDVNKDGVADIYVVQMDWEVGKYCGPNGRTIQLPADVVPPRDQANDLLLVGKVRKNRRVQFRTVVLQHAQPGCGWIAERWDDRTMLVSEGSFSRSGYQLLLEW